MSELGSAPLPALTGDDHVRGREDAPLLIAYTDLECPYCASLHLRLAPAVTAGQLRLAVRHFPVRSSHPRAWAAASAAEAAGLQGRFWELHDSLLSDQGRLEDPHLWQRASQLGLDLDRFEADRRGDHVLERVKRDFTSGVRAGVASTPTAFFEGTPRHGDRLAELLTRLVGPAT
ncbi:MAG TPA: thioredoxin domain-containing protein [Solirubrobacteraceae bacterium]